MDRKWSYALKKMIRIIALMLVFVVFTSHLSGVKQSILPEVAAANSAGKINTSKVDLADIDASSVGLTYVKGKSLLKPGTSHPNAKDKAKKANPNEKIVYLTFDDGPSLLTDQVLGILKNEEVPGTFFVLGQQAKRYPEVIQRIVGAGHVLGNHSYNHDYNELYDSFGHFWKQIKGTEEVLREITGSRTSLVRAPGGTYGHFDKTYFDLMAQAGYKVFDWNIDSGDSKRKGVPSSEIVSNVVSAKQKNEVIVLMHDGAGHAETVKALPDIIKFYKKKGYAFRTLTSNMAPIQFAVSPSVQKKNRLQPSKVWVEENILPNAALFGPDLPLTLEAGDVQTRLAAGEYEMRGGQIFVPIRTTMERLGASVRWSDESRSVLIEWGGTAAIADIKRSIIRSERFGIASAEYRSAYHHKNGAVWMSLRTLLEACGYPNVKLTSSQEERRIKAQ